MADKDIKMTKPHNPLVGDMPKLGIRPAIDGRREGVREALEDQTMAMAKSVAELVKKQLKHPNGLPVECVIADTCIGGLAESAQCDAKFAKHNVGATITVTPCWCYGSETMDMDPLRPKAVWGFNGTERPGAVYLAAVLAGHNQKGLPAFSIYGHDVQDADDQSIPDDVRDKILRFVKAGLGVAAMRGKSYLSLGNVSMGIAGSIVDHALFESFFDMRVMTVDMSEFIRRIDEEIYDKDEFKRAMKWVQKYCEEGEDINPKHLKMSRKELDKVWETSVKMAMIGRDLMVGNENFPKKYLEEAMGHNAIAAGFQGQRQWTDHFPNGDFMEAMLSSSFDWNGIRQPIMMATENDCLNGMSMLFGHLLTDTAQIFADVRTYWSPAAVKRVTGHELGGHAYDGIIHLINSGAATLDGCGLMEREGQPCMKPFWEVTPDEAEKCLRATRWRPAEREYFRGGGFSSNYLTATEMPMTMCRLNLIKGVGPVLQLCEGWSVVLPDEVHEKLNQRTSPTWPTTWFAPRLTGGDPFDTAYNVMANWGANHGAISYGHIGDQLITLASMLRIPVGMHNVPDERLFRPSMWSHFGAMDKQGADFRACDALGPVYGQY
jgi:L-fucose isomerase